MDVIVSKRLSPFIPVCREINHRQRKGNLYRDCLARRIDPCLEAAGGIKGVAIGCHGEQFKPPNR